MSSTGKRLKQIRQQLNLSQEELGKKIGLSKSGVSAVENDKTFMSVDILRTLFIDLNINLNYLVAGRGQMFVSKNLVNIDKDFQNKVDSVLKFHGLI